MEALIVKNCVIKNNLAFVAAGIFGEFTSAGGLLEIENCIFDNNLARLCTAFSAWARSGGVFTFKVTNSLFNNNKTRNLSGSNNGVAGSAGWLRAIGNAATIVNSTLTNNTYVNNSDEGTHSSVNNLNRATVGASETNGGTLNLEVANSIFWNNTIAGGAVANSITGISSTLGQNVTAVNSIDQGGFSKLTPANLTNTSNSDPLFVNNTNDFTLQTGSPAIDVGDNSKVLVNTDLLGNSRIHNTTVDMGVYEFGSTVAVLRTLTITATNGTVTTNPNPINGTYNDGTVVALTATPATGYQFSGWSGDATGTTNPLNITMDADKAVTAMFSPIQRTLTITATNGTVTTNPNPTNGTYDDGTVVTLTATPNTNYGFVNWSGDASGTTNTITVTMNGDKNVTANFNATAGIKDANKIDILIYPNPINNFLTVQLDGKMKIGKIIDVTGKEVKQFKGNKTDVRNISSGIYILKIETEEGKIAIKKIIKK